MNGSSGRLNPFIRESRALHAHAQVDGPVGTRRPILRLAA